MNRFTQWFRWNHQRLCLWILNRRGMMGWYGYRGGCQTTTRNRNRTSRHPEKREERYEKKMKQKLSFWKSKSFFLKPKPKKFFFFFFFSKIFFCFWKMKMKIEKLFLTFSFSLLLFIFYLIFWSGSYLFFISFVSHVTIYTLFRSYSVLRSILSIGLESWTNTW